MIVQIMPHELPDFSLFKQLAATDTGKGKPNLLPMYRRLVSDQLTPVLAYRRLVRPDQRMAPSFLLESVVGGDRVGRYSFLGAQPMAQVIARGKEVRYIHYANPSLTRAYTCDDPMREMAKLTDSWILAKIPGKNALPDFTGGWVGHAGYDTVRYLEGESLKHPPKDDRGLPDMQFGLYRDVVAFDHVRKTVLVITHVHVDEHASLEAAYAAGKQRLESLVTRIETPPKLAPGKPELLVGDVDLTSPPPTLPPSNMGEGGYQKAVLAAKKYIGTGDIFQVVPSQRFEFRTQADPFDIYRMLRMVNPSPYMFYVQIEGGMLVGASPEILCKVHDGVVTNRPLAGTRRRGVDEAEDKALEAELLADPKERCEHIMLVDLGRNDVGRVAEPGSIQLPEVMVVERYSHVMHISSTVTGKMMKGASCWDALRVALPVGTVSGAPKVRAMQIIDELEPTRRGPYGGAVGYADFSGNLDMCIALRTMVVMPEGSPIPGNEEGSSARRWVVHIQAGGGIVADSDPDAEHMETVNKAAAMAKAVALAEATFTRVSV